MSTGVSIGWNPNNIPMVSILSQNPLLGVAHDLQLENKALKNTLSLNYEPKQKGGPVFSQILSYNELKRANVFLTWPAAIMEEVGKCRLTTYCPGLQHGPSKVDLFDMATDYLQSWSLPAHVVQW